MGFIETLAIALGLAMDALAVSIVVGSSPFNVGLRPTFRIAFHFGFFQFLMPVLGWLIGWKIADYVGMFDHWIAFLLLSWIGGKMIYDGIRDEKQSWASDPTRKMQLLILSIATSIDAFALGFSLSMLRIDIWEPSVIIGIVTAILSCIGMRFGKYLGRCFGKWMTLIGGSILCLIGLKILIQHLIAA